MSLITLRPVGACDEPLLLRIYAGTRADELAMTGWDAAQQDAFVRMQFDAQRSHYRRLWPDAEHSVIEVASDPVAEPAGPPQPAGRLWLHRGADTLLLLDIAVLPEWRGQGIGGQCLRRLLAEAAATGTTVSMHVEVGNPARRLYDRLGFTPVGEPQGLHQRMAWHQTAVAVEEVCK